MDKSFLLLIDRNCELNSFVFLMLFILVFCILLLVSFNSINRPYEIRFTTNAAIINLFFKVLINWTKISTSTPQPTILCNFLDKFTTEGETEGLDYIIEQTIPPADAMRQSRPIANPSQTCKGGISLLNPK